MEFWKTIAVLCTVVCISCNAVPYNSRGQENKKRVARDVFDRFLPDLSDLEAKCLKKNGQAVIDSITAELQKTVKCLEPVLGFLNPFSSQLPDTISDDLSEDEQLKLKFKQTCSVLLTVKQCVRPLVNLGLICFTPREGENIMSIWNAVADGADYACYQNGSRYFEFLENDAENCVKSRDEGVTACHKKLDSLKAPLQDFLEFNSKTCKVLFDASSCAVNELQQCPNRRPAELVEGFFNVVLKNLPCKKNLVKGTGSLP